MIVVRLTGQRGQGHVHDPRGIIAHKLGHRGWIKAEQVFGDRIDDGPAFHVVMRARDRSKDLRTNGDQIRWGVNQETPNGERNGEIVDCRRTAEHCRATHCDGHDARYHVLFGLGGGQHKTAMDLTGQSEGVTLIRTGITQSRTKWLTTSDLGRTIGEPGFRSPRGRVIHPGGVVDRSGNVIGSSHYR